MKLIVAGLIFAVTFSNASGEEEPVLVRCFEKPEKPALTFPDKKFAPEIGETIAFLGGTNTFDQQLAGELEARIHLAWPDKKLKIRNLGWQGDTIFYQARPQFFYTKIGDPQPGSTPDIRPKTTPGIIVLTFGKFESLEKDVTPEKFSQACESLITELKTTRTNRLVLVAPTPFFSAGPAKTVAESRNETLQKFVTEIKTLATKHDALFVDLFTPLAENPAPTLTTNGVHLSETGHARVASIFARQLNFPNASAKPDAALTTAIAKKNRLWQQFYRPTNWAFLFGDRQHVPASRDHIDTRKRWFVHEIGSLTQLITAAETEIHKIARK